ncbi:hypothetical protein NF867_05720 [Solitalea sp. MAHUQ-68]|uniref:Uncharacterized protein n=1 Tax=Solitalea agri TaxID=2953739 RepID=A0A9X2JCB6_9SPHI|nr:hypothetical protein [Solitalea agri]MCO4292359.1 hypothetical protein [Solitalea agri]
MESKLDKDFAFLAVGVIVVLIGTFARFIIDSHVLSLVCWGLIAVGAVLCLTAIARVLNVSQERENQQ